MNYQPLIGRMALVTGAGQGNGKAIALGLAMAGASVVVVDIEVESCRRTVEEIVAAGGRAWALDVDVSDYAKCQAMASRLAAMQLTIDLLVNNAGILRSDPIMSEALPENFQRVIDVNLVGTFNVTHALLAQLTASKGTVVNLASIGAFVGRAHRGGYSASKGGVKLLTQSLAVDLGPYGVRVNAIAPGAIRTAMSETAADPEREKRYLERTPLSRLGEPTDLVGPVIFLSSSMSDYITGVTIPVDGGYLA